MAQNIADFPAVFFHISHWYLLWNTAGGVAVSPAVSLDLYNYTAGGGSPLYCVELLKQSFSVKKKAIGLFFGRIGILHA